MIIKVASSFLFKIFAYKNGALVLASSGVSAGIVYYLGVLLEGTETRFLVIPIFAHVIGFCFFFLFILLDLATGLWAAKFQNAISVNPKKNYIRSHKLYRTVWKMLGVLLLQTMITTTCLFAEVMNGDYFYKFTLWAMVTLWIMSCGFEFHSIGENIEKRTGKKPEFFNFFDKILTLIQRKAINKIEQAFDVLEAEPDKAERVEENLNEHIEQETEININQKEQNDENKL